MTSQFVTTDDLDLDIPLPEDDSAYYTPEQGDTPISSASFEKDLAPLDTETDRSSVQPDGIIPNQDTPPADSAEVTFEQPAPIADWQKRAADEGFSGVNSEAEFRDQLTLSDYVQQSFFSDPRLAAAYQLLGENVPEKALIEFDIRDNLKPFENEDDVEQKMAEYFDNEEKITEKGKRLAAYIRSQLDDKVARRVGELEVEGKGFVEKTKEFETTLQADIRALPAAIFSAADKRELDRYIRSGQYERDALLIDDKGKRLVEGSARAKKVLENAQKINPAFEQKRHRLLYEDAKKMGEDEFIRKHFQ